MNRVEKAPPLGARCEAFHVNSGTLKCRKVGRNFLVGEGKSTLWVCDEHRPEYLKSGWKIAHPE